MRLSQPFIVVLNQSEGIITIPEEMDYETCVGHHVPAEVDYKLRYVLSTTLHSKLVFILHKVILKKGQSYNFTN